MALTLMTFDKDWNNKADFPTYEPNEEQVREDMQYLFNQIKDQYNSFLTYDFTAANVKFTPIQGVATYNVQDAIRIVYDTIQQAYEASIVDGSVTTDKLHQVEGEEAVTTETIRDGAVTTDKIDDGAVTAAKLDPNFTFSAAALGTRAIEGDQLKLGAVGADELDTDAVTENKIRDDAVTTDKIHNGDVTYAKTSGVQKKHTIVGPITVATSDWTTTLSGAIQATAQVNGVSLTNVATQKVDWTPSDRATWEAVRDNGVWVLRTPPVNNQVTLECETVPAVALSLYFCIWD